MKKNQRQNRQFYTLILIFLIGLMSASAQNTTTQNIKNIVLVHGAFLDGSGWEPV